MSLPRVQFRIGQVMAAIAAIALSLALLPTWSMIAGSMLLAPYLVALGVAKRGFEIPPIRFTAWVFAGYPLLGFLGLYSTWAVACLTLGRRPRPMADDPNTISLLVNILYAPTIWMAVGSCIALPICLALLFHEAVDHFAAGPTPARLARRVRFLLLIAFAAASWIVCPILLSSDPGGVVNWFMD